jgi:hypothetical protein
MAVGIVALPKNAAIVLRREIRVVIEVRSGKLDFSCDQNHCALAALEYQELNLF